MKKILIIACALCLTGCQLPKRPPRVAPLTIAEQQLLDTASSIEMSLRELAASNAKPARNALNTEPLMTTRGGMAHPVNIDYAGPIGPLLDKIGKMAQYQVKVLGPTPAVPVIVSVHGKSRPLAELLKDAGLQLGERGDVVVYPQNRIIELRYTRV